MDALDLVLEAAWPMLHKVESVIRHAGVPAGHAVGPLLRELGALPVDAVAAVVALRPGALASARRDLGPLGEAYAATHHAVSCSPTWSGPAAQAYAHRAGALATQIDDGAAARMGDTVAYGEAIAAWMVTARTELARTLGRVIGSAQAVTLTGNAGPDLDVVSAAADIAAEVLGALAAVYDDGQRLIEAWGRRVEYAPLGSPSAVVWADGVRVVGSRP
ncbi:hypothetical protein [Pilimelia columellifera]|uniref:Uncharacterized protein n=1 Tax=Pilimelia columellifera subsp. columellifera TaxID=706583 RepID=A0ABP6AAF6_9ACTN